MSVALPARFAQLRLRDLMLLEHLAELGSLTEVAARMHVTQSAISQALGALEKSFGAPLVTRGRPGQRGVRLNEAAEAALRHLRVARQELEAAHAAAAAPATQVLRLGALPLALVRPLPEAIARLRRRSPPVDVHLVEDMVPGLWLRLETGEVDAIVCRLPALTERLRLPLGVAHRTISRETLVLACSTSHPLARSRRPTPADLVSHDWVLPPEGSYTRLLVEQWFLRVGLKAPRAVVTSMNFHANLRLAARAHLLAVAPRAAASEVRDVLGLKLFTMDWDRDDAVKLIWRQANLARPALAAFLDCLKPLRASRAQRPGVTGGR